MAGSTPEIILLGELAPPIAQLRGPDVVLRQQAMHDR